MKRILWVALIIISTVAFVAILWQFRIAFWLLLLALVVSATLRPIIKFFRERGFSQRFALLTGYGLVVLVVVAVVGVLGFFLLLELQTLGNDAVRLYDETRLEWPEGSVVQQAIAGRMPPSFIIYEALTSERGVGFLQTLSGLTFGITGSLALFVTVLVLSIYLTADQARFERLWLSFLPIRQRARARTIWREVESNVGDYTRSELIQSLAAAVTLSLGYWILGLSYPVLLAVLSALVWFIPIVGFLLALIPLTIVVLTTGTIQAWLGLAYTLLVLIVLQWVIEPRFFNRRRFSGLFLVTMLIAFVEQMGLLGLIIAPPITVAIQILITWLARERLAIPQSDTVPTLDELKQRLDEVESALASGELESTTRVKGLTSRLKGLLKDAEQVA